MEQLRASIDRNVTVGKPKFLLLSEPVKAGPGWLTMMQTKNAALKNRSAAAADSVPYSVYRISRGWATRALTMEDRLRSISTPFESASNKLLEIAENLWRLNYEFKQEVARSFGEQQSNPSRVKSGM